MNKRQSLLLLLMVLLLPVAASGEEACPVCDGKSPTCLTDEYGAVYCGTQLVTYPEDAMTESYTVRAGTTVIGEYAFGSNAALREVVLPEGMVMLGDRAFSGCTALERVKLPESLLIIGDAAFYYCPELTGVVLPERLYYIGHGAFVDNWKMKGQTLRIPESVHFIGNEAFANCHLGEVYLHAYDFAFGSCIFGEGMLNALEAPLTLHVSGEAWEQELGTLWAFMEEYEQYSHITVVEDVVLEDEE